MRLVLHIGAHGTDRGQVAAWIAQNRAALEAGGIVAPPPRLFLARISEALDLQRDADPLTREEALLRGLGATGQRRRMVVSAPGLLGSVADVLAPDGFYTRDVARRLYGLRTLFPRTGLSFLLAVRKASGVIPAILPDEAGAAEALLPLLTEDTLPWSRLADTIRRQVPGASLLAWRHEDLPQVWPGVLAEIVGNRAPLPPAGLLDFAAAGLGAEARLRLTRYLASAEAPPASAGQLRQVAGVFARRYGAAPDPDPAAGLPGWARARLQELDAGYATEWGDLAGIEGVRVLMPG
ncbi:hypothetical protein [Pararhodobacter sp.]|uniref:hypothetical protein n=1 Tax=Pararhodobacter sp. TaxID=2127056 RepID=UPI002AFECBAD|nr:hypothetical protein [Pararhodobacter sp.]